MMRKISIGIFAVSMAILFILSTSISVTATLHDETVMDLTSVVNTNSPFADVDMAPQNVWSYSSWNWTVDVSNGDEIKIYTDCYYYNNRASSETDTGEHFFLVQATYENDPDPRRYDDATWGPIYTDDGDYDDETLIIYFDNIDEGAVIIMYWSVVAINTWESPPVESSDGHFGYITLT
jgi:hypothetical protein